MPFIKEEEEETKDYVFQKDAKTISTTAIVIIFLVILVIAVIGSGLYFQWF